MTRSGRRAAVIVGVAVVGLLCALLAASASAQQSGTSGTAAELLQDGGFETGGIPNSFWNPETSTNFGTPVCSAASCGTGGGASPPRTGSYWAWFGGIPAPETATLGQTITIPNTGAASLSFWMRNGTVSSPFTDTFEVKMDSTILHTYNELPTAEGAYTRREFNLAAFADGGSHNLLFTYVGPTQGTGSFVVDDVSVVDSPPTAVAVVSGAVARTGTGVAVRWVSGAAMNLLGFHVHRQVGAKRVRISPGLIHANGSVAGSRYRFVDRFAPKIGRLTYWVQSVQLDGRTSWFGPVVLAG